MSQRSNQNGIINEITEQIKDNAEIQKELNSYISGEGKNDAELCLFLNSRNYEKDLNSMFYFLDYFDKHFLF